MMNGNVVALLRCASYSEVCDAAKGWQMSKPRSGGFECEIGAKLGQWQMVM